MEYITLGNSDLRVSRIGFGCCPMGLYDWGEVDEAKMINAAQAALDEGVNFFDTADIYGLGTSEEVLGRALVSRRSQAIIATKFGVRRSPEGKTFYDLSSNWIQQALEGSLKRLGTDYIDIYQVHYLDQLTPLEEVFELLENFRQQGKVRYFGVTNIDLTSSGMGQAPEGLVSFSYQLSLATREYLPLIERNNLAYNLSLLSWGSLSQGLLSGKYTRNDQFNDNDRRRRPEYVNFHGERFRRNLELLNEMKRLVKNYQGITLSQMALRWVLDRIDYSAVLTGIKNKRQLIDNCGATGWRLNEGDMRILESVGSRNSEAG